MGELAVEIRPGQPTAPAARLRQIAHELGLKVAPRKLVGPTQADGAAREGNVVARLDAVEVLKKKPQLVYIACPKYCASSSCSARARMAMSASTSGERACRDRSASASVQELRSARYASRAARGSRSASPPTNA